MFKTNFTFICDLCRRLAFRQYIVINDIIHLNTDSFIFVTGMLSRPYTYVVLKKFGYRY